MHPPTPPPRATMRIDWQTLQDLGILHPSDSQANIFDWANFTRTQGGLQRLRERFQHPLADVGELRETQDAVRFLMRHAPLLDTVLGGSAWRVVESYIGQKPVALEYPNRLYRWLDSWRLRVLNRDLYDTVRAALALTQDLLLRLSDAVAALAEHAPPARVARWLEELAECLADPALALLRDGPEIHTAWPPRVLAADARLRGEDFAPLRRLAGLVYEIDLLCSLARATRQHRLTIPEFLDAPAPAVEARGLYHPLLERAVANDLGVTPTERLHFITGANMAGKSTYLKAAGVAVFLAHLGMGVPAAALRLTPFTCLFSGINTTDNLRLGQSYFYREVRRVREIVQILGTGAPAFVLFDEMFKGTNLKDAADASLAVLSGFARCRNSAFLVASHISELADELRALPEVAFAHFAADLVEGEPVFGYRLRAGVSEQRLGMLILEREQVLAALRGLGG